MRKGGFGSPSLRLRTSSLPKERKGIGDCAYFRSARRITGIVIYTCCTTETSGRWDQRDL